jgi:hypothetical protein
MVTGQSWFVKIDEEVMQGAYVEAERSGEGKVGFEGFGLRNTLQSILHTSQTPGFGFSHSAILTRSTVPSHPSILNSTYPPPSRTPHDTPQSPPSHAPTHHPTWRDTFPNLPYSAPAPRSSTRSSPTRFPRSFHVGRGWCCGPAPPRVRRRVRNRRNWGRKGWFDRRRRWRRWLRSCRWGRGVRRRCCRRAGFSVGTSLG